MPELQSPRDGFSEGTHECLRRIHHEVNEERTVNSQLSIPSLGFDDVSMPSTSRNEVFPELLADIVDVDVNEIRERIISLVENVVVNHVSRNEATLIQNQ